MKKNKLCIREKAVDMKLKQAAYELACIGRVAGMRKIAI
jgi:hypothetical protein